MTHHEDRERGWDRTQWEGEGQDPLPREEGLGVDPGKWNKQQWEGEGQDDIPHDEPAPGPMGEGNHEFSGHGENPGGGKLWRRGYPSEPDPDDLDS